MKKIFFLLLLLPCVIYSQTNSIAYNDNEKAGFVNNNFYSTISGKAVSVTLNSLGNQNSDHIFTSALAVEGNNTLPDANLLNFHFECGYIEWSTKSESNCSHYLIMFSRDSKNWNILGQVYGAGNSSAMNYYKYPTDLKDVYFKIYQIDFDGKSMEHGPVFGSCKKRETP